MSLAGEITPLNDWINQLLDCRELRMMGHAQRRADQNLGLGWLYYSLARLMRPTKVLVIGSYRGFVPLVMARALSDNSEGGQVHFIDPSLVDDFWKDESAVRDHLSNFGCENIVHHLMTTQQFVESSAYRQLDELGIVFIDGMHSAEQARFDFEAFAAKLAPQGIILMHDSVWRLPSGLYGEGREYVHTVIDFISDLKQHPEWQIFDLPFGGGLTMVRRAVIPNAPKWR
jgi:predicted O-methyltransferase YrrM